jgi:nitroimidazol reductase NimA-like FMN-containing flavoprotein (pyridoxamine 5'-phosphate oxidase superfamily)
VIEPLDDEERKHLLRELLWERYGRRPLRRTRTAAAAEDAPEVIAERRRVLCGLDQPRAAA